MLWDERLFKEWDESRHPRKPVGSAAGGEFAPAGDINSAKHPLIREALEELPESVRNQLGKVHELSGRAYQNRIRQFGNNPEFVAFLHVATNDIYVDTSRINDPTSLQGVKGTIFHEAGHAVFRNLLTPKQRKLIREDYNYKSRENSDFASFNALRDYKEYFSEAYRTGQENDWYGVRPNTKKIVLLFSRKRKKKEARFDDIQWRITRKQNG
jgi:hypothetical protein